jgi:hypothetical protein
MHKTVISPGRSQSSGVWRIWAWPEGNQRASLTPRRLKLLDPELDGVSYQARPCLEQSPVRSRPRPGGVFFVRCPGNTSFTARARASCATRRDEYASPSEKGHRTLDVRAQVHGQWRAAERMRGGRLGSPLGSDEARLGTRERTRRSCSNRDRPSSQPSTGEISLTPSGWADHDHGVGARQKDGHHGQF